MEILNKEQRYKGTCSKCNIKVSCTKEECVLCNASYCCYNGVDEDTYYYQALGIQCPTPCCGEYIRLNPYNPTKKWYQFWK
jgi:hypothetical protein